MPPEVYMQAGSGTSAACDSVQGTFSGMPAEVYLHTALGTSAACDFVQDDMNAPEIQYHAMHSSTTGTPTLA